jgi:hypothetical protein
MLVNELHARTGSRPRAALRYPHSNGKGEGRATPWVCTNEETSTGIDLSGAES